MKLLFRKKQSWLFEHQKITQFKIQWKSTGAVFCQRYFDDTIDAKIKSGTDMKLSFRLKKIDLLVQNFLKR